jgi:hypothetical protein
MLASRQSPTPRSNESSAAALVTPAWTHLRQWPRSSSGARAAGAATLDVRAGGAHTLRRQVKHAAHPSVFSRVGPLRGAQRPSVFTSTAIVYPLGNAAGRCRLQTNTPTPSRHGVGAAAAHEPRTACKPPLPADSLCLQRIRPLRLSDGFCLTRKQVAGSNKPRRSEPQNSQSGAFPGLKPVSIANLGPRRMPRGRVGWLVSRPPGRVSRQVRATAAGGRVAPCAPGAGATAWLRRAA